MTHTTKNAYSAPIDEAITEVPDRIRLMAVPGRAISAPSMTLVTRVIGRSSVKMIPGGSTPIVVHTALNRDVFSITLITQ